MFNYKQIQRTFYLAASLLISQNINAFAAITEIGNETKNASTITNGDSILFTNNIDGILNHDSGTAKNFAGISTDNDGIGKITINNSGDLVINGDIGSATKRINQISFADFTSFAVGGDVYTTNGITTDASGKGDLLAAADNITINSNIGSSGLHLNVITINNRNINFNGNIFVDNFIVNDNTSSTIESSGSNALGTVSIGNNASLTFNDNINLSTLSSNVNSTMSIAAGKQLSGSGALININGTLNLGIDESDSSTALVASTGNITVNNNTVIHFDYNNASFLKSGDNYDFLTTTATLNATASNLNNNITDTSILLAPTLTKVGQSLRLTQNIDATTTAKLNAGDLASANFLINNTTATDIDAARTALFKITTQADLEKSLATLQVDNSNMLQRTAINISSSIENILEYRLQSLNYQHSKATSVRDLIRTKNTNKDEVALIKSSGLWGEVFGAKATQSDVTETSTTSSTATTTKGYDVNFGGVSFGLDKVFKGDDNNSIWGGAVSYSKANAESRALSKQKTDINSYQFSVYNHNIARSGLGFFSENLLSVGYNQYSSERTIDLTTYQSVAKADFSAMQYGAKSSLGYNFKMGERAIFAPIAGIKYFGLQMQDYQETNTGGLGLKVQNDYFDLTTSEVGFRITGMLGSKIEPQINVAWLHNLNSDGATSSSTFINGITTQTKTQNTGIDLDADALNAGAQINFKTSQNTGLMFKYDLQKSANFTSHLGSMKFAWAF